MANIQKTLLISHSALRMYDLVTDIEKYPEFLPWCGGVEIFQSTPELMEAKILRISPGALEGVEDCAN